MANYTDFKYNVSAPESPAQLGNAANRVTGGLAGGGILIIIWIVFFSMSNRRGYNTLASAISANVVTSAISLFLYPLGWIGGEVVLLLFVATAGTIAYSSAVK